MSRTVLFAGGPLHGKVMTVDDHTRTVCALEPPEILTFEEHAAGDLFPEPRQVTYAVFRFAMCGRIVWIGYPGAKPDEDLVFEVLASDGARQASVLA